MSIEDNKAATEMMDRLCGSVKNRIKAAYNYGYKDGLRDASEDKPFFIICKSHGRKQALELINQYYDLRKAVENKEKEEKLWK